MKAADKRHRPSASVSASQLARMGVCERLVVFEHRYGKRCLPEQTAAIERGGANMNGSILKGGSHRHRVVGASSRPWCSAKGRRRRPSGRSGTRSCGEGRRAGV